MTAITFTNSTFAIAIRAIARMRAFVARIPTQPFLLASGMLVCVASGAAFSTLYEMVCTLEKAVL